MSKGYSINVKGKKSVTPECRGSYVNILEPAELLTKPGEKAKLAWGLQCVFPKTPVVEAWVKELQGVYKQVLMDKFKGDTTRIKEVIGVIKAKKNFPVRDGDDKADTMSLANRDQLKGCYFVNTHNYFRQPHVLKMNGEPVSPESLTVDDVYSGAWYRVMLEFWFYSHTGNIGIGTSVAAVMKTKDDENFGGGTSRSEAASAFSEFAEEPTMTFEDNDEALSEPHKESISTEPKKQDDDGDFSFL